MNRLMILGNGFDLAHGHATAFNHFLEAYLDTVMKELTNHGKYSDDFFSIKEVNDFPALVQLHEEKNLTAIFKEKRYPNFGILCEDQFFLLLLEKSHQCWVDVETEYFLMLSGIVSKYSGVIDYSCEREIASLNLSLSIVKRLFIDYLSYLPSLHNQKSIKAMSRLFNWPLRQKDLMPNFQLNGFAIDENAAMEAIEQTMILNFNYTNTAFWYLPEEKRFKEVNLHGNLDRPSSIILGYSSLKNPIYLSIIERGSIALTENFKYEQYSNEYNLFDLRTFLNSSEFQVFSIGHSLGVSDQDVLSEIVNHQNIVGFNIFHYKGSNSHLEDFKNKRQQLFKYFEDKQKADYVILPFDADKSIQQYSDVVNL